MLLAAKSETTYGTDAFGGSDPATGDWIAAYADSDISHERISVENTTIRPFHSGLEHESYGSHCDVTINLPLYGKASSAGDPPPSLDVLLQAAGAEETVTASTDVVYNWVTYHTMSAAPSCTVYLAEYLTDGTVRTHIATGVRLNMTLTAAAEQHVRLSFTGIGLYSAPDSAAVAAPTNPSSYSGGKAPLLTQNMTHTRAATAFALQEFEFQTNWTLEETRNITGANSLDQVDLIRAEASRMGGSKTFRDTDELEVALTDFAADTESALVASWTNGTDTVALNCPAVQLMKPSKSKGNVHSYAVPFMCNANSADGEDEATLTFT
jgi:hypothetical protein